MQATITYLLTEQAQRAQMAATGQPVARKQTVTVEVPNEDLNLMQVHEDGTPYLDLSADFYTRSSTEPLRAVNAIEDIRGEVIRSSGRAETINNAYVGFVAPNPDVLALFRAGRAKLAAEKAEKERADAIGLAAKLDAFMAAGDSECGISTYPYSFSSDHPRYEEVTAESRRRIALRDAREKEAEARRQTEREAAERVKAEREAAKESYIAQWIAEHADEQTRAQFADGLLCRNAAIGLIADAAFAAAGVPEKAPTLAGPCDDPDCPCGSKTVDCLPRSIYPSWKVIEAGLPEGYEVEFSRVRECLKGEDWDGEGESAGPSIYLAEIMLPHGPFVFERTVKLLTP